MKRCEYCGKEINSTYGSGRFCNSSCAGKFGRANPITLENLESGKYKVTSVNKIHK